MGAVTQGAHLISETSRHQDMLLHLAAHRQSPTAVASSGTRDPKGPSCHYGGPREI